MTLAQKAFSLRNVKQSENEMKRVTAVGTHSYEFEKSIDRQFSAYVKVGGVHNKNVNTKYRSK